MLPQTELDNYKLQVELLQEKLKRSEEQRRQLEEKFDGLMQKKNEEERKIKNKRKHKYQQFLDELKERNERNKELVKILERVDHQAAILATKSERLKMMKLQYELYFAKLLQTQATKSIQMTSPKLYAILSSTPQVIPATTNLHSNSTVFSTDNVYQQNNNLVKNSMPSKTLENCNVVMDNSLSNVNIDKNFSYQIPSQINYLSGQIPLHQDALSSSIAKQPIKQTNLKSDIEDDSIILQQSYPNIQMRNAVIDSGSGSEYNNLKTYTNTSELGILPLSTNLINNQNSLQYNGKNFQNEIESNIQTNKYQIVGKQNHENQNEDNLKNKNKNTTVSTLHQLANDDTYGNLTIDIDENDSNKYTTGEKKTFEKSQTVNITTKNDLKDDKQMDNSRQKINEITEDKMNLSEHERILNVEKEISIPENLIPLKDVNKITSEFEIATSSRQTPTMWNFSENSNVISSSDDSLPIKLGKKEKLSIENIENVIYGEKISPIDNNNSDLMIANKERIFSNELVINDKEKLKYDNEFKFDNTNRKEIDNLKTNDVIKLNDSEHDNMITNTDSLDSLVETKSKEISEKYPEETQIMISNQNENENRIYNSEISSNQQYPEQYNQNYDQTLYETSEKEQQEQFSKGNQEYISSQNEENLPNAAINLPAEVIQDDTTIQDGKQYSNQDYQYPSEIDYQNQMYDENYQGQNENYQTENYQYDPNAYQYNYEQQTGEYTNQYGNDAQFAEDGQYNPSGQQYAVEGQYSEENFYQDPNQQIYSEQNYDDPTFKQEYIGNEYQQYASEITADQQNTSEYSQIQENESQQDIQTPQTVESLTPVSYELPKTSEDVEQYVSEDVAENSNIKEVEIPSETQQIAAMPIKPTSILTTEKPNEQQNLVKKKKKVNFIDSESEESSSIQKVDSLNTKSDESDFDFSSK